MMFVPTLSLGNFRLNPSVESFRWGLSRSNFDLGHSTLIFRLTFDKVRLGSFVPNPSPGQIPLITSARLPSLVHSRLGPFSWTRSRRHFNLG